MTATIIGAIQRVRPLARVQFLALPARVAGLLAVYFCLEWWTLGVARLPESSYFQPLIIAELLESILRPASISVLPMARLAILLG